MLDLAQCKHLAALWKYPLPADMGFEVQATLQSDLLDIERRHPPTLFVQLSALTPAHVGCQLPNADSDAVSWDGPQGFIDDMV
jgi:hypothetical protein